MERHAVKLPDAADRRRKDWRLLQRRTPDLSPQGPEDTYPSDKKRLLLLLAAYMCTSYW